MKGVEESKHALRRIVGSSELGFKRENMQIKPILTSEGHVADFDSLEVALNMGIKKTLDLKP